MSGRKQGIPNYKPDCFLAAMKAIKPLTEEQWAMAAAKYKILSKETIFREVPDFQRTWREHPKLCFKNKKPTGDSGGKTSSTYQSQKLQKELLKTSASRSIGDSEDEEDSDGEDNEGGDSDEEYLEDVEIISPSSSSTPPSAPSPSPPSAASPSSTTAASPSSTTTASVENVIHEVPSMQTPPSKKVKTEKSKNSRSPRSSLNKSIATAITVLSKPDTSQTEVINLMQMNNLKQEMKHEMQLMQQQFIHSQNMMMNQLSTMLNQYQYYPPIHHHPPPPTVHHPSHPYLFPFDQSVPQYVVEEEKKENE